MEKGKQSKEVAQLSLLDYAEVSQSLAMLREKYEMQEAVHMPTSELLAIALGTTVIESSLNTGNFHDLMRMDIGEIVQSLGREKGLQLHAILEIARRLTSELPEKRYVIASADDAAKLLMPDMRFLDHEEMRVVYMNTQNEVMLNIAMYKGTINSSVLRAAEIFRPAITRNYPNILLAHNHPSGNPDPSPEDIEVTMTLIEASKVMDIDILDHLIIGNKKFTSLKERLRW